jgi:hypothetical protein
MGKVQPPNYYGQSTLVRKRKSFGVDAELIQEPQKNGKSGSLSKFLSPLFVNVSGVSDFFRLC